MQSLCEGCKSRHATESAYTTKRALQWLGMRVQKRQRRVFARRQMHCIWRARRKRKRRPCHHVAPPSAVQPYSRQDEGYGATYLSDICRNFINCSKVLALSGERRSRPFDESLFEDLPPAVRTLRRLFQNLVCAPPMYVSVTSLFGTQSCALAC